MALRHYQLVVPLLQFMNWGALSPAVALLRAALCQVHDCSQGAASEVPSPECVGGSLLPLPGPGVHVVSLQLGRGRNCCLLSLLPPPGGVDAPWGGWTAPSGASPVRMLGSALQSSPWTWLVALHRLVGSPQPPQACSVLLPRSLCVGRTGANCATHQENSSSV